MPLIDQLIGNMLGPETLLNEQDLANPITVDMGKRRLMTAMTGNRTAVLGSNNAVFGDRIEIRLTVATRFRLIVKNSAGSILTELRAPGMAMLVFDGSDWGFEARSSWNGPAVFNVKDFGARGDDQADELVAIQQALDAVRDTGNGGVLYFPRGIYRVRGDSLKLPRLSVLTQCYMVGEGRDVVTIIREDAVTTAASLTFVAPSTITRSLADTGSFVADGWAKDKRVIVSGTGKNNTHGVPLTLKSVSDKTLMVGPLDTLVNEVAGAGVLSEDNAIMTGASLTFVAPSNVAGNLTPSTITRSSADTGSFVADGWAKGKRVIVSGTGKNNTHGVPLTLASVTDKTLTFGPYDSLVNEVAGAVVLSQDAPLFEGDDRDALPKPGIEANKGMGFWTFRDMTWSALNCTVFRWNFGDLINWNNSTYRLTAIFENILLRPSTVGTRVPALWIFGGQRCIFKGVRGYGVNGKGGAVIEYQSSSFGLFEDVGVEGVPGAGLRITDGFRQAYTTGIPLTFSDATKTISRSDGGSFVSDGFTFGETITVAGTTLNDGTYTLSGVVKDETLTTKEGLQQETTPTMASVTGSNKSPVSGGSHVLLNVRGDGADRSPEFFARGVSNIVCINSTNEGKREYPAAYHFVGCKSVTIVGGSIATADRSWVYTTGIPLTFSDATKTISRSDGGSFVSDGFTFGETITVAGTALNDGTYTLSDVVKDETLTTNEGLQQEITPTTAAVTGSKFSDGMLFDDCQSVNIIGVEVPIGFSQVDPNARTIRVKSNCRSVHIHDMRLFDSIDQIAIESGAVDCWADVSTRFGPRSLGSRVVGQLLHEGRLAKINWNVDDPGEPTLPPGLLIRRGIFPPAWLAWDEAGALFAFAYNNSYDEKTIGPTYVPVRAERYLSPESSEWCAQTPGNKSFVFYQLARTTGVELTFDSDAQTINRSDGGSFLLDGFESGDVIVVSGTASNNGPKTIASVTAAQITTSEPLTAETAPNALLEGVSAKLVLQILRNANVTELRPSAQSFRIFTAIPGKFFEVDFSDYVNITARGSRGVRLIQGNNVRVEALEHGVALNGAGINCLAGGIGVLGKANAAKVPTCNPVGGVVEYVEGGAQKVRTPRGVVTTIASELTNGSGGKNKLVDRLCDKVQTTNASQTTVVSYQLPDDTIATLRATVVARDGATGNSAGYERVLRAKRHGGGAATIVGSVKKPFDDDQDTAAWDVTMDVTDNSVRVQVTGAAATMIEWFASVEVVLLTP
jgi:hypothetical protein